MAARNATNAKSLPKLTRTHRILIGVVIAGAVVIAAIGFAGSYAAVRDLARQKGFGAFSLVFPIGIDAGIVVLLSLDLLLTWIRIPFPLLRQTAWLLTAATIAFNGAAAWPDPLGVGMHAVIPVLFVVSVEAARHAIGRIADITADRHMESVRIARWLLAFPSTFRLWRRMKLWELRSYDEVIQLEQERLVYRARLRARYGRAWRRKAPVESLMPLRLARYGVPISETGPAGLAAAGIDPPVLMAERPAPAAPAPELADEGPERRSLPAGGINGAAAPGRGRGPEGHATAAEGHTSASEGHTSGGYAPGGYADGYAPQAHGEPYAPEAADHAPAQPEPESRPEHPAAYAAAESDAPQVTVPVGPNRYRNLGQAQTNGVTPFVPAPRATGREPREQLFREPTPAAEPAQEADPVGIPDGVDREDVYFEAYRRLAGEQGTFPTARQLSRTLNDRFGVTNSDGSLLSETYLRRYVRDFRDRIRAEMGTAG